MRGKDERIPTAGRRVLLLVATAAVTAIPATALAQRVDDNAVTNANDAFGQSVGNERVGLYGTDDVRGFNPVDAGNVRIEGLYFAPVDRLPNRLTRGNRVRVGIAAQGYPFPAPTGIVDFELSASGEADQLTVALERAQFGSLLGSVDSNFALGEGLRAYLGGTVRRQNRHEGAISDRGSPPAASPGVPMRAPASSPSGAAPAPMMTRPRHRSSPVATTCPPRSSGAR